MEADLRDALIAWQSGHLPEGRADQLLERLRSDLQFQRAFAEEAWTLSLSRLAQAPEPRWLALYEEIGLGVTERESSIESVLMDQIRQRPARFVQAWWQWAACGSMAAAALLFLAFWVRQLPAPRSVSLATLVATQDPVWKSSGHRNLQATESLGKERLQLTSGRISIGFNNGVVLHVQGPADLDLVNGQRVFCRQGQLRMRVPPGAEGFCIDTPGGIVTDLGTELGVAVAPGCNTRVAVFEGKAEASLQLPGQGGIRTELLQADEGAELLVKTGEIRPVGMEGFLKATEVPEPALVLRPQYAEAVMESKPVLYWRLNRLVEETIPNEVAGGIGLRIAGGVRLKPDVFGRVSAQFGGKADPGVLFGDQSWQAPGEAHALEMWFLSQPGGHVSLAGFTTGNQYRQHFEALELPVNSPGQSPQPGIVRYLTRWPAGGGGGVNVFTPPKTLPYRWHHVVAQQERGRMEVFVDGQSVGRATGEPFPGPVDCALQFGCLVYNPTISPAKLQRPLSGRLAEIAFYPRLLSLAEIQRHAAFRIR